MPVAAIDIKSLHKYYGKVHALRGLSLSVNEGEIFGFLGPNGAGKTTTIRCMLDLIRPDSGSILIFGDDPQKVPQDVKAKVGYLPGDLKVDGDFTPRAFLKHIRHLRRNCRKWEDLLKIAERLDLNLDQKFENLSQGNKQKVGFLQSFIGDVPLIMMDEPTLGLDPLMKQEVLNIIRDEAKKGITIFFSSHVLSEVQQIADRVGIIREGVLVEIAHTDDLINRAITRASIVFMAPVAESSFKHLSNVKILHVNNDQHTYILEVEGEMDAFIKLLAEYPVRDLAIHRPSLEEVFLQYYKNEETEA